MNMDEREHILEQIGALLERLRMANFDGHQTLPLDTARRQSSDDLAYHLWRIRRLRDEAFGSTLFDDPAWDMLIDLFKAEKTDAKVTVSSLCAVTGKPLTTALRVLSTLEDAGLVKRTPDVRDRRRVIIAVTASARLGMDRIRNAAFVEARTP